MANRIYWSERELERITQAYYDLEDSIPPPPRPNNTHLRRLRRAQEIALPSGQHRNLRIVKDAKRAFDWIRDNPPPRKEPKEPDWREEALARFLEETRYHIFSDSDGTKEMALRLIEWMSRRTPSPMATEGQLEVLLDTLADKVAIALASPLEAKIEAAVQRALETSLREALARPEIPMRIERVEPIQREKPSVLIIGLLPDQEAIIRQEYSEFFKLKFLKSNRRQALPHATLKGALAYTTYAIVMTDFASHSDETQVKHSATYRPVSGGMTSLKRELAELVLSQQ